MRFVNFRIGSNPMKVYEVSYRNSESTIIYILKVDNYFKLHSNYLKLYIKIPKKCLNSTLTSFLELIVPNFDANKFFFSIFTST